MSQDIAVSQKADDLVSRLISAVIMIVVVSFLIYNGGWLFDFTVAVICILAIYEFARMTKNRQLKVLGVNSIGYVGYLFHMIMSQNMGAEWVAVIILSAATYDVVAYVMGKNVLPAFNIRSKIINPEINERKTYEGAALSTIFGVTVITLVLSFWLKLPIGGSFFIATGATMSAAFGDLFNSKLKRINRVKDSGNLIPGHGGVLDRVMSHFFVAMFVAGYLGFSWAYLILFILMVYVIHAVVGRQKITILGDWIFNTVSGFLDWTAIPLIRFCLKYRKRYDAINQVPNALILIRLLFFWVPVYFYYQSIIQRSTSLLIVTLIAGIFIGMTDAWDGRVARAMKIHQTGFGKTFDPAADKLFSGSAVTLLLYLIWFVIGLPVTERLTAVVMPVVYISFELLLVVVARPLARKQKKEIPHANNSGKVKFVLACLALILVAVGIHLFLAGIISEYALAFISVGSFGAAIYFAIKSILGYYALIRS